MARVTAKVSAAEEEARARAVAAEDGESTGTEDADTSFANLPPEFCFPTASAEDRALLLAFLLHCADLHNPLLNPVMSQRIAGELSREFAAQAAQELAASLPVTVMLATTELQRAQMEISFIDVRQRLARATAAAADSFASLAPRSLWCSRFTRRCSLSCPRSRTRRSALRPTASAGPRWCMRR